MYQLFDLIKTLFAEPFTAERTLARRMSVSKGSVNRYRQLIRKNGYKWDKLRRLTQPALDAVFNKRSRQTNKAKPDFEVIKMELDEKKIVTLYQLWKEYRRRVKGAGYSYSRYAHLYAKYRKTLPQSIEMRQTYRPGGVLYVDFSGEKPTYIDRATGHHVQAELFVGVLAASNYTYACVLRGQAEADVIDAHIRMFEYFGGAAEALTPDNMKTAVIKTRRQGLELQADYQLMAEHYGVAPLPTRPYKPRDKGKVEGAVKIVQQELLAPDRHRIFKSFEDLETAIAQRLEELNGRAHSKSPDTRRERFECSDRHALKPLPAARFTCAPNLPHMKVPSNYHLKVEEHHYSVPFELIGEKVQAKVTPAELLVYFRNKVVAQHPRSAVAGGTTTLREHQAPNHQAQAERTPEGYAAWAKTIGPNTEAIVAAQFDRSVPLNGLMPCEQLKALEKYYPAKAIERACAETVARGGKSFSEVERALYQPVSGKPAARRRVGRRDSPTTGVRRRMLRQYKKGVAPAA